MRSRLLLAALMLSLLAGAAPAVAALPDTPTQLGQSQAAFAPREDAIHTETWFPSSDGITSLHADILRPLGMPVDAEAPARTPVVLTVSPYTSHNGSTTDTDLTGTGPSPRFYDFLDLTGVLERGYTYVMVDLPGFGGSGGCNDWGGLREQGAVRAAVEWAASQPWSNGNVALLGKSYDAWTGLMGIATQPRGLAAVVAMEPVYSGYRYMYANGVRRPNFAGTMAGFQAYDAKPGRPSDSPEYLVTSAPQGYCYATNMAGTTTDDSPTGPYWAERDLGLHVEGRRTPLFLMQGFLETNTRPEGAFAYFNGLAGEDNRAWLGQYDHVRGWETTADGGRFHTGRSDFVAQLNRFLDEHLLGVEPAVEDPAIEVQDIRGRWRAEASWPPADALAHTTTLRAGSYTDSGSGTGLRPSEGQGLWTVSQPLPHDVWLAGEPFVTVSTTSVPNANLAVNVYEIDEDGQARMISRGAHLLRGVGSRTVSFALYGQDWPIAAGHRIAVLLSSANTEEFQHVATRQAVTVDHASIDLPFLTLDRVDFLAGDTSTPRLEAYLGGGATTLGEEFLEAHESPFTLPAPLARPQG